MDRKLIQALLDKTADVLPDQGQWQVHYAFFVRSDLTTAAQALAQENQTLVVNLDKIESDMQRWLQMQKANN